MEAATLFTLTSVLGLRAGAICGVVAKRTDSESVAPPDVYRAAEKRFQVVARRALELLLAWQGAAR
jgi:uridine phosphorylase